MSLLAQINNAAHTGAFGHNPRSEPTLAQLAAGNYKKGVVMVKGLSIAIENPAYTYRKGMDKTGQQWMCLMQAHYGYIQGHKGNDGDDMDVFIGVAPENDTVYIVNQKTADGYFDEHKIMLGFLSQQQAVDTYQHCFERGWTGLMSVVPCTMTQFKWWLANGDKSRPVTLDRLPYAGLERLDSVNWGGTDGSNLYSHDGQVHKLLYQIRQCDDTHQALEPLAYHDMIAELGNQGFMYENYDALIVEYNKLEKKAKQLLMVMQGAADTVKPVGVTVSKPLTKGGVANVVAWFEMDDGQAVGVFFHNPDKTPKKINPTDEMISYKWVLNKKDITIAVAPEQGKDLIIRTVAKRIMLLVEKNHDRFIKANGDKAALNQAEQDLSAQVAEKQATLKGLQDEVAALQVRKAEKEAAQLAQEKVIEPVVQEPEATLSNRFAEHDAIAKQYGYSVNSSGVIFTPKGKNTGVKIDSPTGRLKISNAKELLFSGVNPTGLGKFLESYWYAEKTKAVVVPTVSAEQEPVTLTGKELGDFEPIQERPSNWRTNIANARAVAKSLGIETKGKKLERLIKDVDIFDDNEVKKELLVEFKALASRLVLPTGYMFDLSNAEKSIGDITRSTAAWIRKQGKIDTNTIRVELRTIPDSSQGIIFNSVHIYTDDPKTKKDFDKFSYQRFGDIGASSPETPKEIIAKMELFLTKSILPEIEAQKVKNSTTLDTVDLPSLGVANIESIGAENIYIEKDGKYYISKVGNPQLYALGEWDFAKYPEGKLAVPVAQPEQAPVVPEPTPASNKKMYTPKDILDSDLSIDEKISEAEKLLEDGKLNAAKQKIKIDESNKFYLSHARNAEGGYLFTDLPRNASLASVVHAGIGINVGFIEYLKNLKENTPKTADTQAQTTPDIGDTVIGDTTLSDLFKSDMDKKDSQSVELRVARQSILDAEDAAANAIQSNSIDAFSKYADMFPRTYNALLNRIKPPMTNPDRDYLQSIIDGEADLSNGDDVEAKLTDISERLDAELEPMFEQAAEAFAQYAIAQAATV